ncbi:hypothetical protein DFH08DRAFT_1081505 [Mycena albidolilacea]|uniref:Uncharacterized protein n=1 Tax=Mycena albidolilacea TaxID=1033008 RepID=A0AAD6ZY63_9AGAR|nr:hypothetical protein DFH08DRAFT_1081505 [Mycena albidolilacea]
MFPNPHSPSRMPPSYRDAMYVPSRDVGPAETGKRYRPLTLRNWVVTIVVVTLLGLAAAIEILLALSKKNGGFPYPERNVFTTIPPRFVTAFFPTLLVAGLLMVWQSSDRSYRELQPYIVLAKGNATAAEGLLTNYSGLSVWSVISNALKYRHYLILLSTVTTILGSFLQPLAGSVVQYEQLPMTTTGIFVQSTKTIGLDPDIPDLNAFLAAAGFAEAAVFHSLPDPPFIHGGWAISEFQIPSGAVLNGTLSVNTTAIQTTVNCEASQSSTLNTPGTGNFTIQATNSAGCTAMATFNPESTSLATSSTQYGAVPVQNCGEDDVQFQPIMFWFFHRRADDGTPEGASVFCAPSINAFNVIAKVDLNNGSIINVTTLDSVTTSNNVTGPPQNGQAFNSIKFPPSNDTFVQARATSISAGVSGAIFRFAAQLPGGVQDTFDNGFLPITEKVFTQHLSISAKSIYFVKAPSTVPASMVSLVPRFVIAALPAHALVALLVFIGLSALFLHILHSRQRRRYFLAASPGSIAHIISVTAHARFGEKLYPYDDDETLALKLAGLSFGLDPRTGAIVADRDLGPINAPVGSVTPYNMRSGMSAVNYSTDTAVGAYSEKGKTRASMSPTISEGSSTPGPSIRSFDESQSGDSGQQLPSYMDDIESQSSRGLTPPVIVEKRGGRIDTSRGSPSGVQQGETLPLLG